MGVERTFVLTGTVYVDLPAIFAEALDYGLSRFPLRRRAQALKSASTRAPFERNTARPIRNPVAARYGRDGRGLSRARYQTQSRCGDQGVARRRCCRSRAVSPL